MQPPAQSPHLPVVPGEQDVQQLRGILALHGRWPAARRTLAGGWLPGTAGHQAPPPLLPSAGTHGVRTQLPAPRQRGPARHLGCTAPVRSGRTPASVPAAGTRCAGVRTCGLAGGGLGGRPCWRPAGCSGSGRGGEVMESTRDGSRVHAHPPALPGASETAGMCLACGHGAVRACQRDSRAPTRLSPTCCYCLARSWLAYRYCWRRGGWQAAARLSACVLMPSRLVLPDGRASTRLSGLLRALHAVARLRMSTAAADVHPGHTSERASTGCVGCQAQATGPRLTRLDTLVRDAPAQREGRIRQRCAAAACREETAACHARRHAPGGPASCRRIMLGPSAAHGSAQDADDGPQLCRRGPRKRGPRWWRQGVWQGGL